MHLKQHLLLLSPLPSPLLLQEPPVGAKRRKPAHVKQVRHTGLLVRAVVALCVGWQTGGLCWGTLQHPRLLHCVLWAARSAPGSTSWRNHRAASMSCSLPFCCCLLPVIAQA